MKNIVVKIMIALLGFVVPFELGARLTDLDMKLIKPLLYYQGACPEVHRASENTEKIYELIPNVFRDYGTQVYGHVEVRTNSFGFRDKERTKEKGKNVFRIVCFGGSNTFGAEVSDNETYPFYLEELLNTKAGGKARYEVWNAGCCAYSQIQDVETAKMIVKEFEPDLLIFQRTNDRRRAFEYGTDFAHFFRENPELYWENLRYVPGINSGFWRSVFLKSCAYRSLVLLINHNKHVPINNMQFNDGVHPKNFAGICRNDSTFAEFYKAESPHIPVLVWYLDNYDMIGYRGTDMNTINIFNPVYYPKKMGKEYFEIHPPKYVYQWYAESMYKELKRKKLV